MQKSQVVTKKKKIEPTEGEKAVETTIGRRRDVLADAEADGFLVAPKWVKPNSIDAYIKMIRAIVQIEFSNIRQFCRDNNVSIDTIYRWMKHQDTKDLVDQCIKALAVADKPKVYEMILSQVPVNASYARLWAERYEDYQPSTPKSGNVNINFNFLQTETPPSKPVKEAEDADFDDTTEDNSNKNNTPHSDQSVS